MSAAMIEFDERHLEQLEQQRASASVQAKLGRYAALLAPSPGERLLDVGCGSGAFCRSLMPLVQPGGWIIGIDPSVEAIALARRLAGDRPVEAPRFEVARGEALPFADGTFDAATCVSVLAFCERPDRVLAEIRRVLRPGGRLLVANSDEDMRAYGGSERELGRAMMQAIADRACHPWIGRQLAHLVERSGFRIRHESVVTEIERQFQPGMAGFILAHALRDFLIEQRGVDREDYNRWIADLEQCDRLGTYSYCVTNFAYLVER